MSRLIDADKIDFNEVFVGASEFAQDTRNAAQMLIDNQPTAFDVDKVMERLEKEMKKAKEEVEKGHGILIKEPYTPYIKAIEIIKEGGIK